MPTNLCAAENIVSWVPLMYYMQQMRQHARWDRWDKGQLFAIHLFIDSLSTLITAYKLPIWHCSCFEGRLDQHTNSPICAHILSCLQSWSTNLFCLESPLAQPQYWIQQTLCWLAYWTRNPFRDFLDRFSTITYHDDYPVAWKELLPANSTVSKPSSQSVWSALTAPLKSAL